MTWLIVTVLLLVAGIVSYFYNLQLLKTHVVDYAGKRYIVGDKFTPAAEQWCQTEYNMPCGEISREDLILDYSGKITSVWTQHSIDQVSLRLAITYVLIVPVFAATIMSTIQMVYCFTQRRKA